jgi:predicted TIM-barrel fold metal-dependent hydrolase
MFIYQVKDLVLETIGLFTTKRCMFASNYPVDKEQIGPKELYSEFLSFVENFSLKEKRDLFYETARIAYKM